MRNITYQVQRVLIVVAMSAMMGYGEDSNSEGDASSPKIEKTLVAHPGETLQVNSRYASQTIDSQAGNQVSVVVTRSVLEKYEHDANRILREHKVEISRDDHGITIYTDVDDSVLERWQSDYDTVPPLRVHVKALVPKQGYDVNATTTFGSQDIQNINGLANASAHKDINISNVGGDLHVSSRFGGLTIRDVAGSVLRAEAHKKVDIKHVKGPHVNASSRFGSLTLDDIDGSVNASAHKDINISNVGGDLHVSSRFGGLTIRNVAGSILHAEAHKKVDIEHVKGPHVNASSRFGSLTLDDIDSSANASAHKDVNISNVGGDLSASSSFGSVTIHHVGGSVHANARGDVVLKDVAKEASIRSSFGKVRRVQ